MKKTPKGTKARRLIMLLFILTGGLVLCLHQVASAKEAKFPTRPITVINPFKPGGGTDVELQNLSPHIQKHLGQPIVVKSIPGGGSTLGAVAAARAKPDGYTLFCANIPTSTLPQEFHGTDSHLENFEYIYAWFAGPNDVTVGANSPYKRFQDLVEAGRKKPIKAAVAGIGTTSHLHLLLMEQYTGLKTVMVPYAGGGPSTTAVIRGDVDVFMGLSTTSIRFVRDGKLRQLLILGPKPLEALPDTPTVYQLGYKDYPYLPFTRGMAAPPGTPRDRVKILEAAFKKAVDEPGFKAIMEKQGRPITIFTGDEFKKYTQDSLKICKKYMPIMKQAQKKK